MGETINAEEAGIVILFYIFFILCINGLLSYVLSLVPDDWIWKQIPYPVHVFLLGFIVGITSSYSYSTTENVSGIIDIATHFWDDFPPELMIYLFLPILVYKEVVNLNTHHFLTTLGQGLLLAVPISVASTLLMGLILNNNYFAYPVTWGTNGVYLFCSTLAATDSVSVVSVLNKYELFRSQVRIILMSNRQ